MRVGVVTIVAIIMMVVWPPAAAVCRVRLNVDAAASPLTQLDSSNLLVSVADPTLELGPVFSTFESVPRGFSGILYAESASLASCPAPSDRGSWLSHWPSFSLTSVAPSAIYTQPVSVYPALLNGMLFEKYDYNLSNVQMTMRADSTRAVPGQPGNFTADWSTELIGGSLSSRGVGARVDSLQNLTAAAPTAPMRLDLQTVDGLNLLVMEVTRLELLYRAVGLIDFVGSPYNSYANHSLKGVLTAKAVLDCPSYCGDFGRCAGGNVTVGCVCDCGWAASEGQCSVPWGFCSADGGQLASNVDVTRRPPPPPPPPAPSSTPSCSANTSNAVAPVDGACPPGYDWDDFGVLCKACPSGFSGSGCVLCNSDLACKASLGSSTAQCSLSPVYRPRTSKKHYSCTLLDPTVASIVGDTMDFTCSTVKPGASSGSDFSSLTVGSGLVSGGNPVGASPYCRLSFRLSGMPRDAAVQCTGWGCEFALDSSRVFCPVIKCECPKGCSNAEGSITEQTFTNLRSNVRISCGQEVGLGATTIDGNTRCRIELGGLPITAIPASCKTTECIDPVNGTLAVTTEGDDDEESPAVAPIIAWVPTMVLTIAAAAAAAATAAFVRAAGPGAVAAATAAAAAAPPPAAAGATAGSDRRSATVAGEVVEAEPRPRLGPGPLAEGEEGNPTEAAAAAAGGASGPYTNQLFVPLAVAALPPTQQQQQQPQHPQQQRRSLAGQHGLLSLGDGSFPPWNFCDVLTEGEGQGGSTGCGSGDSTGAVNGGGGGWAGKGTGGAVLGGAAGFVGKGVPAFGAGGVEAALASEVLIRELSWHGLTLSTRPRRPLLPPWRAPLPVTLLRDVSGRALSGEVLGVMGPSGSGKTTLLNVLAGLTQPGFHWNLSGRIALDGRTVAAPRHLTALVGHVPQTDMLARSLTVTECVAASAALRLSRRELAQGRRHVQSRVAAVLRGLRIDHLAARVVWSGGGVTIADGGGGGGGGTLSGGERLRVAIALELVYDPPLLLLDEPLSGLDSATARTTMDVLHAVAAGGGGGGRVVLLSVHQPSPALFAALTGVLLMVGGRVACAGPPACLAAALAAAGLPPPPPDVALADHLLDLVVTDSHQANTLAEWHAAAAAGAAAAAAAPPAPPPEAAADAAYVRSLLAERGGGSGVGLRLRRLALELGVVTWRSGLDVVRNPSMAALHVAVTAVIGLLVGAVFSNTNLNVSGAQNRVGAIFFAVMLLACFATSAVDAIYSDRALAERDLLRGSYGTLPYLVAKLVLDGVVLRMLPAWAFALPFYWLMGLRDSASAFFTFAGAFTTMACLAGAACIGLCFVFSSPGRTVLVLNLLLLTCALFSGFLANKDSIVAWLRWIVYLSPIRFCWEALVINELEPLVLSFSSPDLPQGLPAVRGSLFLSLLGVDADMLTTDLIVLGCMYGIVVVLAAAVAGLRLVAVRGSWK